MNKILIFLLSFVLTSCGECTLNTNDRPILPTGVIDKIKIDNNDKTVIYVKVYYDSAKLHFDHLKYYGSDTCKVGQIVNLK